LLFALVIFLLFIYSDVHTLFGPFLPPASCPLLFPSTPSLPGRTCSALLSNFVEDIRNNKKDIAFLLVEIRIAIQRDS
jgi:hypothetical protein